MDIKSLNPTPFPNDPLDGKGKPQNKVEAARQFEEVLVREFVKVMTKDLFKSNLSGDQGPSWMDSYSDMQRDIMTDTLTKHLVDDGKLGLADLLTRRWGLPGTSTKPDNSLPK